MTDMAEAGRCLNCGAPLHGPFCASCGQRAVPPNPTVRELAGDAWQEMSGYDGRIRATIRGLLRPGFLTNEYVAGRRAHYLPPVRVYLIVSVVYFVIAAAAPGVGRASDGPGGLRISIEDPDGVEMTDADRARMRADLDEQAWFLQPMLRSMLDDPQGFRQRLFTVMPRVFFAMLPLFAGIVTLCYRRRTFPAALVFSTHIHAFAYAAFAVSEAAKFTRSTMFAQTIGLIVTVTFTVYALRAFRTVFGDSWPVTIGKTVVIGALYVLLSLPAFVVMMIWASFT